MVDEAGLRAKGAEAYSTFDGLRAQDQKLCVNQPLCTLRKCRFHHLKEFNLYSGLLKVRQASARLTETDTGPHLDFETLEFDKHLLDGSLIAAVADKRATRRHCQRVC